MKKHRLLICVLLSLFLLVSCGTAAPSSQSASAAQADSVTFTDDLGRTVTVDSPKRVAALIGSFADVWCIAGGKDTLVAAADDTWTQFDLDLDESVIDLGKVSEPSAETLLAAQPDFVLASTKTSADVELMPTLENAGIPTAYFDVSSFEDYLRMLEICTRITGCEDRYEQYGTLVQEQVDAAIASAQGKQGPTVLYLRATGSSCKVKNSQNTVLGEMLADLGCTNIADSDESLLETLSMEAILQADPECIFIVLQGSDQEKARQTLEKAVLSNPAWQQLRAVQQSKCYYMDQQLYNVKPNARWGEAYEGLAEILYGQE
ncbi:ABC transporter substrate-binding protein [Ruthenibacterium sp. CLA-JM-H11]|uniref:ABC transporter substrate-binding protein n=1 Tax=Ruthenibacterium intestinale TaxID=3133163 RepID=A0ABV1GDD3_9FIRM